MAAQEVRLTLQRENGAQKCGEYMGKRATRLPENREIDSGPTNINRS